MSPKRQQGGSHIEGNIYLTEKEACNYLRTCKENLRKWRKGGLLKSVKISRQWIYRMSDLDDFFEKYSGKDLSGKNYLNFVKKG